MELIELIHALRTFYFDKLGQPPREITLGRMIYEKLREEGHVEIGPSWQARSDRVAGMRIDIDIRDDFKIAIEDYRRYHKPMPFRKDFY